MKRRRVPTEERRRPLVEPNLVADSKTRSLPGRKGCALLAGRLMMLAGLVLLVHLGLR